MNKGNLIIITAPSGTGKTSLVRHLLDAVTDLQVSVSYTTRPPRSKDKEGVDYHFVDETTFLQMIEHNDFLEHAKIYGYHYGTSRSWVNSKLNQGVDVLLEIDWQGARQIMQLFSKSVSIFILPPSIAELKSRITKRAQDSAEVMARRLATACEEIKHYHEFSYLVLNENFTTACKQLEHIILAQRLQTRIQQEILSSLLADLTVK